MPFKKPDFTIDDAFSESAEDRIRLYTRTSESVPLTEETIQEEPAGFSDSASSPGDPDSVFVSDSPTPGPPILKTKGILQNPSLRALKTKAEDSTSQDSTSLLPTNPGYYSGQEPSSKMWWSHPKIKQNWKVVTGAAVLVFLGAGEWVVLAELSNPSPGLILTGIVAYSHPRLEGVQVTLGPGSAGAIAPLPAQGFIFFIAGLICLLPGAYHLVYVYLAVKGKRGFDFHHLPLMN
jgi:hypothetical protein